MSVKREAANEIYDRKPDSRTYIRNKEELLAALEKGEDDIRNGRTEDAYEALERLRKYVL